MKQAFSSLFAVLTILALSTQSALCQDTAPAPEFEHEEVLRTYDRYIKELEEIEAMLPEDYTIVCPDDAETIEIMLNWARSLRIHLLVLKNMHTTWMSLAELTDDQDVQREYVVKYVDTILAAFNCAISTNTRAESLYGTKCFSKIEIMHLIADYGKTSGSVMLFIKEYYNTKLADISKTEKFYAKWYNGQYYKNSKIFELINVRNMISSIVNDCYYFMLQFGEEDILVLREINSLSLSVADYIQFINDYLNIIDICNNSNEELFKILIESYEQLLHTAQCDLDQIKEKADSIIKNSGNITIEKQKIITEFVEMLSAYGDELDNKISSNQ